MKKIRIAQIGIGHDHSSRVFQSLRNQPELFDIAGYAFTDCEEKHVPQKNDIFEGYRFLSNFDGIRKMSIDEILNDRTIDAVTIETSESELFKYSNLAVEAGKHVHMDKPGGFSLEEYKSILRRAEDRHLVFHTGYMYRYNPYVKELMESVKKGDLGDIISVYADMSCNHVPEKREWLNSLPGGMMFFLGCHMVDLVMQIMGTPNNITPYCFSSGVAGVESKDVGLAVLEYPRGISIVKSSASEIGGFVSRKLIVNGTKKSIVLQPLETYTDAGIHTSRIEYDSLNWVDEGVRSESCYFTRFEGMMADFAGIISGDIPNKFSYEYEYRLYETLLKCCGAL